MSPTEWKLAVGKLKRYPHFDSEISSKIAESLANDPARVAKHTFYPFIRFLQRWTRFADKGKSGKEKTRPIRYAARADAYIFARYRHDLSERYEAELARLGLCDSILAYRRLPAPQGGGMCNIHFAKAAFEEVQRQGDCCVIALDISSFFESIDHKRLKNLWCRILGADRLPDDHFKVFEAITQYAVVDKVAVYERLGYFGPKRLDRAGRMICGYLTPKTEVPKQLCRGSEFQAKIAGGDGRPSIIKKNFKPYGIPQGAPISDLLANLSLIDFDVVATNQAALMGGKYFRYSDDILFIVPVDSSRARTLEAEIRDQIASFGRKLRMKEEKSSILRFWRVHDRQLFEVVFDGQSGSEAARRKRVELIRKREDLSSPNAIKEVKDAAEGGRKSLNGLEYLGFRFDGKLVYLRDSTLSSLWRKITRATRRQAGTCVRRYPNLGAAKIERKFEYERLIENFGRVEEFGENSDDYRNWTFWTYARRSAVIFGAMGNPIMGQLRGHRQRIKNLACREIDLAVERRRS